MWMIWTHDHWFSASALCQLRFTDTKDKISGNFKSESLTCSDTTFSSLDLNFFPTGNFCVTSMYPPYARTYIKSNAVKHKWIIKLDVDNIIIRAHAKAGKWYFILQIEINRKSVCSYMKSNISYTGVVKLHLSKAFKINAFCVWI